MQFELEHDYPDGKAVHRIPIEAPTEAGAIAQARRRVLKLIREGDEKIATGYLFRKPGPLEEPVGTIYGSHEITQFDRYTD